MTTTRRKPASKRAATAGKELIGPMCETCGAMENPTGLHAWGRVREGTRRVIRTCVKCEARYEAAKAALDPQFRAGYTTPDGFLVTPTLRAMRELWKVAAA